MQCMKTWLLAVGAMVPCISIFGGACGGKAVIDPDPSASSGGAASGAGASGAGTPTSAAIVNGVGPGVGGSSMINCGSLTDDLRDALTAATNCDSCDDGPDPCEYTSGVEITDECGCPVAVNVFDMQAFNNAMDAFNAWRDSCDPLDCQAPCGVTSDPQCRSLNGNCPGTCRL